MNRDLLHRIRSYEIDDSSSGLKFSDRLAKENAWSKEFTARAIEEYKRFLYLCAEAGHAVTPSEAVDQVWHLHLCYTRSYWHDLCQQVLGFPLHHGPTRGGTLERAKFSQWYGRTLQSYADLFDEAPPDDIWPQPEARFGAQDWRRIDFSRHFVIPKRSAALFAGGLAAALGLIGCTANGDFPFGLGIFVIVMIVVVGILISKGRGGGGGSGGGCGWFGCGGGSGCSGDSGCSSGCGGGCGGD